MKSHNKSISGRAMKRIGALIFFITFITGSYAQPVVKGQADASQHDFSKAGAYSLNGTWEFYWNTLLSPVDFPTELQPEWFWPWGWNRQSDYPALGCATYRMQLKLPEGHRGLAIFFPVSNASGSIWINGELVSQTGVVSTDPKVYKPKLSTSIVSIPEAVRSVELIVQVANYSYFSGGLAGPPKVHYSAALFTEMNRTNGVENFFAGSLIAMFFYQLILYFLYHRGKPHLWLSLICLGVALRSLIVHGGSFLLPDLFPDVSWEFWKKIEFGSVYAIVAFFPLYIFHLFADHAPKRPLMFFAGLASGLCLVVLITPQYTYGKFLDVAHIGLLLSFIYAVYSMVRAWRSGNKDARIILFGVLTSFPFILAEILKNSQFFPVNVQFMYLVELGVLVFLLFQVYLLANHYALAYKNLEAANQNLERVVEERTSELVSANTVKDRLLSVMSHDIKSPLNSLRGVLNIYSKGAITKDEFSQLTLQIENDLGKTSMLVENILNWTANHIKGVHLKTEKFNLFNVMEEILRLFDTHVIRKKISIHHNVVPNTEITCDRNIFHLVLRNLLSNAIKFSFEGSKITVMVAMADQLEVQVMDTGVGMDSATLQSLLSTNLTVSTSGTGNETGTGLGLGMCREYLNKAGGSLTVDSTVGKGTTITFTLPRER